MMVVKHAANYLWWVSTVPDHAPDQYFDRRFRTLPEAAAYAKVMSAIGCCGISPAHPTGFGPVDDDDD